MGFRPPGGMSAAEDARLLSVESALDGVEFDAASIGVDGYVLYYDLASGTIKGIQPVLDVLTDQGDLVGFDGSIPVRVAVGSDGQVLVADSGEDAGWVWAAPDVTQAELDAAKSTLAINTQTGDYTLVLGDAGKVIRMNKATAQVFTIPPQASVAWVAETVINVRRVGAGSVTITPGAGVTIPNRVQASGADARTVANQYGEATLHRVASDVWELVGDIA